MEFIKKLFGVSEDKPAVAITVDKGEGEKCATRITARTESHGGAVQDTQQLCTNSKGELQKITASRVVDPTKEMVGVVAFGAINTTPKNSHKIYEGQSLVQPFKAILQDQSELRAAIEKAGVVYTPSGGGEKIGAAQVPSRVPLNGYSQILGVRG